MYLEVASTPGTFMQCGNSGETCSHSATCPTEANRNTTGVCSGEEYRLELWKGPGLLEAGDTLAIQKVDSGKYLICENNNGNCKATTETCVSEAACAYETLKVRALRIFLFPPSRPARRSRDIPP